MNQNHSFHQAKQQLAKQVKEALRERFADQEINSLIQFVDIFWHQLAIVDWQYKEVKDVAGCCYALWHALHKKKAGPLVQVFNPTIDEHGWECKGTAIIVRHRDMPFLVDTLRLEVDRSGWPIHTIKSTVLGVERDADLGLVQFSRADSGESAKEALIFLEVGLIPDESDQFDLRQALLSVLGEVECVVDDYGPMLDKTDALIENLNYAKDKEQAAEVQAFLQWLKEARFTFLAFREFLLDESGGQQSLRDVTETKLGLFKYEEALQDFPLQNSIAEFYKSSDLIAFSKSGQRSKVHRHVYPDYVVIKQFDEQGRVIGEARFLGLYTFAVYSLSPVEIPIIRKKIDTIVQRSHLVRSSHDGKNLMRVLENFPRDELFQSDIENLFETVMSVAWINERRVVRLFVRVDRFHKFLNAIAYVPRDIYNTRIRQKMENYIAEVINASAFESTTYFSESVLARAFMVFRLDEEATLNFDYEALQAGIVEITRGWDDRFESALLEHFGESKGIEYFRNYGSAFSASYQEHYDARSAVSDIELLETLQKRSDIAMHFFQSMIESENRIRFKVMRMDEPLELSDVIPVLEHLGMRVLGEHPYRIHRSDKKIICLHDFDLTFGLPVNLDVKAVSKLFEQAFSAVWSGHAESDAFNRLVLGARLNWREVVMLRAYAAYMKQTEFTYSQDYIADTLANQLEITRNLVALFKASFDPRVNDGQEKAQNRVARLQEKILAALDEIQNLNEDRILRRYFELMNATLRTNFYQKLPSGEDKAYVSFKLNPRQLSDIPQPKPMFEIFVYSPRIEGVHLRGGKVARGGLRWSDRLQDYRTEVLGLVKAQQVKNAVIVPTGAKGGFVAKRLPTAGSRDEMLEEGIACYRIFIRGLLDLTDNYCAGELVAPEWVICKDEPDPYLVVAADKGTASFSDIANEISLEYGHWLGDAFASGGSQGYDHKKMGITAKGAWVSVQRHFREQGKDIQNEAFTVLGIGDMSGDVFGNGMLLSEKIQLVAAFNHLHIFLDPNPEVNASFAERKRLFDLPKSSWTDYKSDLISKGGGVYSRSAKYIDLTDEVRERFDIQAKRLNPTELINALLKAPLDLIWNGGIGTYVKASSENNSAVGDKANDGLRVNGKDLRCKVFGEGGNLGVTQLGRIEFCRNGGACNTDFIDNSAGVDCSDHEVNIKILLDETVAAGDLTQKQRNLLLAEMTDQVSDLVLDNNYRQTGALSLAQYQAKDRMGEYERLIHSLEESGRLNRALEFLPSDEEIKERNQNGEALTRPELAVLLSYTKVLLKDQLLAQNVAEEEYLKKYVESAFPEMLLQRYKDSIYAHRLLKEIVATQVANDFVNSLGIAAAHRLVSSSGTNYRNVAVAFVTAKEIFRLDDLFDYLQGKDNQLSEDFQQKIMVNVMRRVRRGTRWFIRNRRAGIDPELEVQPFKDSLQTVNRCIPDVLEGESLERWQNAFSSYEETYFDERWRYQLAMPDNMFSGLSAVEVALQTQSPIEEVVKVFFRIYDQLELSWLAWQITDAKVQSHWQAMARETFLDDLDGHLRSLTASVLDSRTEAEGFDGNTLLDAWLTEKSAEIEHWLAFIREFKAVSKTDFAMFSVAIRELKDVAQIGV